MKPRGDDPLLVSRGQHIGVDVPASKEGMVIEIRQEASWTANGLQATHERCISSVAVRRDEPPQLQPTRQARPDEGDSSTVRLLSSDSRGPRHGEQRGIVVPDECSDSMNLKAIQVKHWLQVRPDKSHLALDHMTYGGARVREVQGMPVMKTDLRIRGKQDTLASSDAAPDFTVQTAMLPGHAEAPSHEPSCSSGDAADVVGKAAPLKVPEEAVADAFRMKSPLNEPL